MNLKRVYLLCFVLIIFIVSSCASQKKLEFDKVMSSYEVNEIEKYIEKYPNDERISEVKYRLQVIEYEKVKKSNSVMLLNYFILKYKKGSEVENIRDIVFNIKIKQNENDLKYLNYLKTVFNTERHLSKIDERIYKIIRSNLSKSKEIKTDKEEEEVKSFIEKYPTNPLLSSLRNKLLAYQMKKALLTKNLNVINDFIQKHPEYYTKEVKDEISTIILTEYKEAPLNILKRYLDNNKSYKDYDELERTYVDRAYKKHIAFYEYDKLMSLDAKYNSKKYIDKTSWFKKNKEKSLKVREMIQNIYKEIPYTKEEKDKLYYITKNSIEESRLIIKSAFFTNDINTILKKVSSNFLLTQVSAFKALEYYYNQDISSRRVELYNKIKVLDKIRGKFYKEKIMLIAFVLDDDKLFLKYLKNIVNEQNKTLWINYLRYKFLSSSPGNLISLIYDNTEIDFKVVYSDKTLEKNRIDRKINLALTRVILNNILSNIQKNKIATSKHTNRKISKLEFFLKDIQAFDFSFIKNYERSALNNLSSLKESIEISDLLKNDILNSSPIKRLKKELKITKCSNNTWCNKKRKLLETIIRY